ncbi:MAG: tetratricopeptide repeat protein [Alphaproteobacteria bacterium]
MQRDIHRLFVPILVVTTILQFSIPTHAASRLLEILNEKNATEPRKIVRVSSEYLERRDITIAEKVDAYKTRAKAYLSIRRERAALTDLEAALNLAPDDTDLLHAAGGLALKLGQNRTALRHFNSWREISPSSVEGHTFAAISYKRLKQYPEALIALEEVLKINPNLPDILGLKATLLIELGKYLEAVQIFDRLIAKLPSHVKYL